jgi:hypothetical protein
MSQDTSLFRQYDPEFLRAFTVGATAIVEHCLYKQDTDGTLIIAGDNESVALFLPLSKALAGEQVVCAPVGTFVAPIIGSNAISAGALICSAANGKVRAATTSDYAIGREGNYHVGADGELVVADTVCSVGVKL